MTRSWPSDRGASVVALVLVAAVCLGAFPAVAQDRSEKYAGRRLSEALGALQGKGLRIVFSSEIVTPDMRVLSEPAASTPRKVLDDLLKPHGLTAEDGPGGVVQIVRVTRGAKIEPRTRPRKTPEASGAGAAVYRERVLVAAPSSDPAVGSGISLGRAELQNLRGVAADDPVRALQILPRVAASDDFRSEFSVRGSAYRHTSVVVDGVATPWLRHAAYGRADAGSVAMFTGDALDRATLEAGAYPQRHDDRLGAQLALTLREGSRTATHVRGSVSGSDAALTAEGPFGGSDRGSWLVTLRRSYLDWPIRRRTDPDGTAFGFADAYSKLVYDVRPGQQLRVAVIAGRSGVDGPDERAPGEIGNGANRAALVNVGWRSTIGRGLVVTQQAHLVGHAFLNKRQDGLEALHGSDGELSYRTDVLRTAPGGLLEAGAQIRQTHASRVFSTYASPGRDGVPALQSIDGFDRAAWLRSGYLNFQWTAAPGLTMTPGLRIAHSSLVRRTAVGRWILGAWSFRSRWTLNAAAGVSHQFPEFEQVLAGGGAQDLAPERAAHAELGIERRLSKSVRWQATIFDRSERDLLREPVVDPRIVGDVVSASPRRYENALTGSSRGIELLLERRRATGLSGWVAYSYGRHRQSDAQRHETFWADFDERHAINVTATYGLSDRANVGARFRGGTNFPIPGYVTAQDGGLGAGSRPNDVRLPAYARLDVRAQRTLDYGSRRMTVFVEVLNVLNRSNVGVADGVVTSAAGTSAGLTRPLLPRLPSAGIRFEF